MVEDYTTVPAALTKIVIPSTRELATAIDAGRINTAADLSVADKYRRQFCIP
jgi:hypothetical protein